MTRICIFSVALIFLGNIGNEPLIAQTVGDTSNAKQEAKVEPAKIIDDFVQAFDGEMQLYSYETMRISMEVTRGESRFNWVVGHDDQLIYSNTSDGTHVRVFSEKHAWTKATGEWALESGAVQESGILAFPHYLTLSRLIDLDDQFEYRGQAEVVCPMRDEMFHAHLLVLPSTHGEERHYLFDVENGHLVSHRYRFKNGTQNEYFYEFKPREELDGKLFLSREFVNYAKGMQMSVVVNNVELDKDLDPSMMACPPEIRKQIEQMESVQGDQSSVQNFRQN